MFETDLGTMKIEPNALRYARERVSLSRCELAKRMDSHIRGYRGLSVDSEAVELWESGSKGMTSVETWAATEVCMFPFYALFEKEPPPEPFSDFRSAVAGHKEEIDYTTHRQLYRFERFYELVSDISSRLGESETINVPTALMDEPINAVARRLRESLGVSEFMQSAWVNEETALSAWKSRVSELGVFVFSLPLNIKQIRGASRWDDGAPPAVLISTSDVYSARSFTLMHELAHLMHRHHARPICDPSRDTERGDESRMNRIAAEVLVPEQWVIRETDDHRFPMSFKEWPVYERVRLSKIFGVSNQMMGIRLKELGVVHDDGYRSSALGSGAFFSGKGTRKKRTPLKHERYRSYLGTRATDLLKRALASNQISFGEIVKHYIDVKTETVEQIIAG